MPDTARVSPIPGVRETVLVAPDSFKGTFTATEVAEAVGEGLREAGRPTDLCPVADGGEGTLEALRPVFGGELRTVAVRDPLGRPLRAPFLLSDDGRTAIVETAAASGLGLVPRRRRDPLAASTVGPGARSPPVRARSCSASAAAPRPTAAPARSTRSNRPEGWAAPV
jgi:glycerate 2-kinase